MLHKKRFYDDYNITKPAQTRWNSHIKGHKWLTCHGISPFVWQGADRPEQHRSGHVCVQVKLCSCVTAVLDHAHPRFVLADLKGASRRWDEVADVFEVWPADTRGAVHQEHHIGDGTDRAFWEKREQREEVGWEEARNSTRGRVEKIKINTILMKFRYLRK